MTLALDTIACASALDYLRALPDGCVNTVVTSPPYFNLRNYKVDGQIGLENTPQAWVAALVAVFSEARRVLRDDGTMWVNVGDCYGTGGSGQNFSAEAGSTAAGVTTTGGFGHIKQPPIPGMHKNLMMLPARLAIALQDDGWILRSDIIWAKSSVMPESVTDRPTKSHEHIFLFVKKPRYWYDAEAVREKATRDWTNAGGSILGKTGWATAAGRHDDTRANGTAQDGSGRNLRDVWTLNPEPSDYDFCLACNNFYSGPRRRNVHRARNNGTETKTCPVCGATDAWVDHYAAFPSKLVTRCLLAGCPPQVCAECGRPWTRATEIEYSPSIKSRGRPGNGSFLEAGAGNKIGGWNDYPSLDKHVTTTGFRPACSCSGGYTCTDCGFVIEYPYDKNTLVPNLRGDVRGPQANSEVLQSEMREHRDEDSSRQNLSDLQKDIPSTKAPPVLLQQEMLTDLYGPLSRDLEREISNDSRIYSDLPAEPPEFNTGGVYHGASPSDGASPGEVSNAERDRAPHKWEESRQQTRESTSDGQDDSRQTPTAQVDSYVSVLRSSIPHGGKCPRCGGALIALPAPTISGTVLDFFMGSGTTALAARALGRHYLGCDLSESYTALARERLAAPWTLPMAGLE